MLPQLIDGLSLKLMIPTNTVPPEPYVRNIDFKHKNMLQCLLHLYCLYLGYSYYDYCTKGLVLDISSSFLGLYKLTAYKIVEKIIYSSALNILYIFFIPQF